MPQIERIRKKISRSIPILKDYEFVQKYSSFNDEQVYQTTCKIQALDTFGLTKIHYACGKNYLSGWLNVDAYQQGYTKGFKYYDINLVAQHPFPDNYFERAFAEDFLEHLHQCDSFIFLAECYRTLRSNGVLRLSFPGLEGVLQKHYPDADYRTTLKAKKDAYTIYEHLHFYSREELKLVGKHLGYREIYFVDHGISNFPDLQGLDTREAQIGLNTYVELVK